MLRSPCPACDLGHGGVTGGLCWCLSMDRHRIGVQGDCLCGCGYYAGVVSMDAMARKTRPMLHRPETSKSLHAPAENQLGDPYFLDNRL